MESDIAPNWVKKLSFIAILTLIQFGSGCSATFKVKSDPISADVSIQDPKTGEKKLLGKTPIELSTGAVKSAVGDNLLSGEYFTVIVEKTGFLAEKLMVPSSRFGVMVLQLDVKLKSGRSLKEESMAKDILNHLFLAQKFARSKEYERAQMELDKILNTTPDFARALAMRGSIFFLQKNYPESLKWYEQAISEDPQMEDAVKMATKIRGMKFDGKSVSPSPGSPSGDKKGGS